LASGGSDTTRWWEHASAITPGDSLPQPPSISPTPAVPPSRTPPRSTTEQLEQDLAATRAEARALRELLEELPAIFESKFQQRLQTVLDQQQFLLAETQSLRQQLMALAPADPPPTGFGLGRRMLQLVRRGRGERPSDPSASAAGGAITVIPSAADGPPTASSADPRRR
jgi:hypothetical protein